ncbi:MAG: tryptophan--tRNA ligase [Candidatus Nealsonbacteria bacterium CG_4_9_14_0_2_um_filter_37_38]|uniref:Tryptophan--tRNA ligase n=1 Tax=Candidatus Nealsonbacteria bacterium CG_4_10_14_0_8_um_filter_37_14 TaxID=1974684 RepID=A0A2M7R6H6_9BACT|nr:MAG: tryptophan--tRNA ligase [Candidatus Nealsonbacteria bacterium CG11_big_fil_rev_8_21_14_0_20_37_68]PIW91877.1 MAG: tryptophan--tRNA ligase [Candidatus Nealsonbacteria bacterium CG_4_8_14_3_um_filter_37_23]PIY89214.1 MAG: tryptophan--tRNA ligase [Candidatus Nealsonbacteria bacterium CG_4_10_14_0_8_um_filter_37_14]PJC51619.1 MAG: tryptophan--tRNA ligase [Candidatus Nealsonbacteria bacterium CG_4_9_14_0_2_um_filter_37_38]
MMRVFSGIRPTGELHIGNYLGAIKQWIELQKNNECIFCIVDLHAITTPFDPAKLQKNIFEVATAYLAVGLDPEKCIFFIQSQIKEHSELAWLLGTITPLGELQRMTQFKEKAKKHPEYINAGLLNYPLLMAADILLYQTDLVPVGKDQQQHVELTREIARHFNGKFGKVFKEPKVILPKVGEKIMSLQNPKKKMSKTDGDLRGCIDLFDTPEEIQKKIMSAVTDTGKAIIYDPQKKPGISNLLTIYSLFSGKTIKELEKKFKNRGYAELKKSLAVILINSLEPFRRKKKELSFREVYVKEILKKGRGRAETVAQSTMQEVRKRMGLQQ